MLWWSTAACFLLTDADLRAHDRQVRQGAHGGTDTGPEPALLTVTGQGLHGDRGATVFGLLRRGATPTSTAQDDVQAGAYALAFADPLDLGERYRVDVLVDLDGDGVCTDGAEPTFRVAGIQADEGGPLEVEVDLVADVEPDACALF